MDSKEIIENELKFLIHNLEKAKKEKVIIAIKQIEREIKRKEQVLKDLEVLDQLKEILSMDYLVRVYGYEMAKRLQTYLKSNEVVKEWLENER